MIQKIEVKAFIQYKNKVLLSSITADGPDTKYYLPGGIVEFGESIFYTLAKSFKYNIDYKAYDSVKFYNKNTLDVQLISILLYYYLDSSSNIIDLGKTKGNFIWVSEPKLVDYLKDDYINLHDDNSHNANANVVVKPSENFRAKLFTDGGSRGNPGPSALGYVIYDINDNIITKSSKYLGVTTNNQAEYQAVKYGLEDCFDKGYDNVEVYLDSQLVANQMNGVYKIKNRDLWPIHQSIKELSKKFKNGISFTYIPRELNKEADTMVNIELDSRE